MKSRKEVETLAEALGGMPVWGVLDGSVAARAGIRYGDIVLEVNGLKTPDARAFLQARDRRADGCTISYHRDGRTHEVELLFDEEQRLSIHDIIDQTVNQRLTPFPSSPPPPSKPN